MRFSVIIVNHNYGAYIGTAIQSVLNQTHPPFEIIVVDDGSTDNSIELINTFSADVTLITQPNLGHVAAFQAGYAASLGDVLIFLDADDFLYPTCLVNVARRWTSPQIAKIQYRLDTVDEHGISQGMPFPYLTDETTAEAIRSQAWSSGIYPWTVCSGNAYDRRYLEKILPIDRSRFPRSPDGYANKLAPLYGDVVSLPLILGAYRVHGRNVWAQGHSALDSDIITRTVKLDLELDREFRRRGKALGLAITPRDDLETPQHLEYRFLALRLSPKTYPVSGERPFGLLQKAVRSTLKSQYLSLRGRLLWLGWFCLLAASPPRQVETLYRNMRSQTKRSGLAKSLVSFTRRETR